MGKLNKDMAMLETITELPIGTGILAFRDLQEILKFHISGKKALDFGCGAGRSSRLLKKIGFDVVGVDKSLEMIKQAKIKSRDIKYILLESEEFALMKNVKFDLILLSFVIMEISKKEEIVEILSSLSKMLFQGGKLIIIAASNDLYTSEWLSIKINPKNQYAVSGEMVEVFLKDYGWEIKDYYWREEDCEDSFIKAGLELLSKYKPLGKLEDNKPWIDEYSKAPFIIYVLQNGI